MKKIGLCALIAACFLGACGKENAVENATGKLRTQPLNTKGLETETIDINGDTAPDQWIYKQGSAVRYAQRDFNFDGVIDMTEFYEDGQHVRDEIDLDYDGIVDLIITYKNGIPAIKEYSVDFEGNRHGVQIFDEKGNRSEIRRDADGDGVLDTAEYYEPGSDEPSKIESINPN